MDHRHRGAPAADVDWAVYLGCSLHHRARFCLIRRDEDANAGQRAGERNVFHAHL